MNLNFLNIIKQKFKSGAKKAFSLNDLSILVSTAAIVVVSSVAISNIKVSNTKQKLDAEKIEAIYNNIGKFLITNKRLPCPAGVKRIRGKDANYAIESFNSSTGACTVDEIAGVYYINNVNSNLIYGSIPALTLGLDSEYAEDQYGSKIIYVIDKRAANRYSAEIGSGIVNIGSIQDASIIVKEDNINVSADSVFAIITVGKNKLGGFNANSSANNELPTDSFEQQNSYTSISGQVIAMDNILQKSIKDNTVFDDIVFFANRKSLIADFKADFLIPCIGADTDKYSSSTASFGQILYAKNNCIAPYANLTPAIKCEKDGKWVYYTSCPCYLKTASGEVNEEWVPNGQRTAKCLTEKGYDGVLKYTCNEDSTLLIPAIDSKDRCQKRCNTTGIVGLKNVSIPDGVTSLNCDEENYQGTVVLTCENGLVKNPIIGSCKIATCSVGGYSGMMLGTYPSGTLGASGVCDTANGYTGSYKCDCIDGEAKVYDECYKKCTFSTLGIDELNLNHGNHTINCGANFLGGPVSVNCNDGTATIKSGKCYKNGECSVGNGAGMIPLSVPFNTSLKTNGQCLDGYQGSYSYSCSIEGVAQVTNNCNKILKCIFSDSKQRSMLVDGMLPKDLDVGTVGVGECIPGYGGFYKWNCSAVAVGSITEDNCEKSCKIGGTSGTSEATVDYGKTGENICDIVNGYAGTYTWSCAEDANKKVVGTITNNNCFNTCFVGTPLQGSGMYQKSVILDTSGIDGTCASGYVGSYSWRCEKNGFSSVVNNCKNICRVGVGTGMVEKNVAIPLLPITNNTGSGDCDSAKGYIGSYNWTCSNTGVGNSVSGCVLRSCNIYDSVNRNSKTSSAGLAGKDGTCKAGYYGSFSWGCSFQGVGSVISDDCQAVTCLVTSGVNGFSSGTVVSLGTNDYYCNGTGYRTDLTARFKCDATGSSAVGVFSQVNGFNYCDKVRCTIPSSSNTTIAGTVVDFTGLTAVPLNCKSGYSGNPSYTCTGTGAVGNYNPSGTSCTQNSCNVLANTGYSAKLNVLGANSFDCDAGYTGTINYVCNGSANATTNGTCAPISCTISGTGYLNKSVSASGSFNCDAGFAGSVSYACTGSTTASISSNTCTAIKCSSTAYNGISASVLTNLAFAPANSPGSVTCNQTGYAGTASYTCTGINNPGQFALTSNCACDSGFELNSLTQACGVTQCNTSAAGFQANTPINYSTSAQNHYYCNDPVYNNLLTSTFPSCTTSQTLSPTTNSCVKISCSTTSLNTTTASIFIGNGQNLMCATGYYSPTSITTNCIAVYATRADDASVPSTGALSGTSGTCTRIKCTIPAGSNLTLLDLTPVDFTTSSVPLACKSGFVSSLGATNPSYTCKATGSSATGNYSQDGICNAIKCTSTGFGYANQASLDYAIASSPGSITCTQTGYTGVANYTCTTNGSANITKVCDCDATNGYSRNSLAEACVKVQCSIPSGSNLTVATGTVVDFTTGSNTGSLNCASGFYNPSNLSNSVTYKCKIGTGASGSYQQTGQCVAVTCPYGLYSQLVVEGETMNITSQYNSITQIIFASYGTPYGDPWSFYSSSCHASTSLSTLNTACLNKTSCSIVASNNTFGDPCVNIVKKLIVQYKYEIPGITGITSVNFGNGSLNCSNGYSGTINYNCDQNRLMSITGGKCNAITCSTVASNGYSGKTGLPYTPVIGGGTIACDASSEYTGNANYTCQTQGSATITKACDCNTGYAKDASKACVAITCVVPSGVTGFAEGTAPITFGTNTYYCNASGYDNTKTASITCGSNGTSTTGSISYGVNNCVPVTCSAPAANGYNAKTGLAFTSSATIACDLTGYTGNVSYSCGGSNNPGSFVILGTCACDATNGYARNTPADACAKIQCSVPASANANETSVNFTNSGSLTCKSGFVSSQGSTNPTYKCVSSGSGSGTNGTYTPLTGSCVAISCVVPSGVTGFAAGTTGIIFGTNNYNCNATGYNTTKTATFTCGTNGTSTTGSIFYGVNNCTQNSCTIPAGTGYNLTPVSGSGSFPCNAGYSGIVNYTCNNVEPLIVTSNTCAAISCTISGTGYLNKSVSASGSFNCDAGFAGSVSYACTGSTTASISSNTCTAIKCSSTAYNGISASVLTNLAFAPVNSPGSVTCNQTGYTGTASYTCTGETNPGQFALTSNCACDSGYELNSLTQACGVTQCNTSAAGFQANTPINYSTSAQNHYYCNDAVYNNLLTATFPSCTTSQTLSPTTNSCVKISCSTTSLNTTTASIFIGSGQNLMCATGYYSASGVKVDCVAVNADRTVNGVTTSVPSTGTLTNISGTCARIKCTIPAGSNLTISDGSQVDFSTSSFPLACKSGFVSSLGTTNPSYTCKATGTGTTGNYVQTGSCVAITCVVTSGITGFATGTTGIIFGTNTYNCNAAGYLTTSTASLKCEVNGTSTTGIFSQVSNNCTQNTCNIPAGTGYSAKSNVLGASSFPCDAGYSGTVTYSCNNVAPLVSTSNNCAIINCTIPAGTGYASRSGSGVNSFSCDAGYSGTINYTCTGDSTATTSGNCIEQGCTIPSTYANLLSYTSVPATSTLSYIPCASGYYDYIKQYWPGVINKNSNETTDQHGTRIYNAIAGVTDYASCWGGCGAMLAGYGLSNPMTKGQADAWCESPCAWHNSTAKAAGLCICDGGNYSAHFPTDAGSGLAYKCVKGNLYASSSCRAITCTVPSGITGFAAGTTGITFGTQDYACNDAGYRKDLTARFTCASNGNNAAGSFSTVNNNCALITCTIPTTANTTIDGTTVNYITSATGLTCKSGFAGSPTYTCTGNANTGTYAQAGTACTAITCTAPGANGYDAQSGLAFTATAGTGTIACTQTGYTGNANYTCQTQGPATITKNCDCAPGYIKDANNSCVNKCTIPAVNGTTQIVTNSLNVSGNGTCAAGYTGYFSYNCNAAAVGTITLNNCYQGTFTEKLFTYTTSSQNVSGSPGAGYGLTWPDVLTLNLPADYLYTSRVQMINGFYYSCGSYGTYHSAGISKTSGYGATGGVIGSYCEPQPGSYNTSCNAGPQLMNPGIELRNGDVLRFSTSNYTGCGYSNAYFTLNLYYMAKPSCTVGGSSGMVSKVVYGGSSGSDGTCQAGYSGSYNWSCNNSGVSSVTNNCAPISCTISGTGYLNKSVSASGSFNCDAGFAGSVSYSCTGSTTASISSNTCVPITCTASAANGYGTQSGLAFTATAGTGTIACTQTGYTGNANYTCQTQNAVATITKTCDCASGYAKDASGVCVASSCPVSLVGISNTSVTSGAGNLTCGNGYTGTVSYSCGCSSENVYNITTNGSYSSYYSCPTFTLGTIPVSGILKQVSISFYAADQNSGNYCSYENVNITDSASNSLYYKGYNTPRPGNTLTTNEVVNTNVSAGNPIYFNVCSPYPGCSNTINTFNLSVKIQTGSSSCSSPTLTTTGTCTPITCTVNAPNTTTNGAPVNFKTTATALTCNPGFVGTPTYTCTGTTNPGTYTAGGTACSQIQCTIASANTTTNGAPVNFTTTATALTCNAGFTGSPTYTCTGTSNPGSFVQGGTACVANSNVFTPNWNAWTSIGCGSYISQSSNNMIEMIGPNGCGAQWSYFFTYLPAWATKVSFNWFYCTPDWGAQYDPGRFYVNNTWYDIITSGYGYGSCYSGTFTNFAVQGGTAFGPGVYSTDGSYGGPNLKLYNIVVQ